MSEVGKDPGMMILMSGPRAEEKASGLRAAEWEKRRLAAVRHVVHDYANFVSSAEMAITGRHRDKGFDPPINIHINHAFLLNCRKMTDFFGLCVQSDDVIAAHYVSGFNVALPTCNLWRGRVNKQLAHVTDRANAKEVTSRAQIDMYSELVQAWKDFLRDLPEPFAASFEKEIRAKLHAARL